MLSNAEYIDVVYSQRHASLSFCAAILCVHPLCMAIRLLPGIISSALSLVLEIEAHLIKGQIRYSSERAICKTLDGISYSFVHYSYCLHSRL